MRISTDFSSIPEFLEDGVSGLLVPPQAPEALFSALEKMITNPKIRTAFSEAAHRRLKDSFQMRQSIEDLVNRFQPYFR